MALPQPSSSFDPRARECARLGWFGGTFDPLHRGHLHVARTALNERGLDHVTWVPAGRSPHKQAGSTSAVDRARMVELGLADESEAGPAGAGLAARSSIWTGEAERGGASYTVDSVREVLAARRGQGAVFLLLGSDQLVALDRWRQVEELLALVTPLVVERPGAGRELLDALAGRVSGPALAALEDGFLAPLPVDLASTQLRRASRAGAVELDLTPRVRRFVDEHGLYRGQGPGPSPDASGGAGP
ncbi:MAG: nicotinate-nicotinamide nucleotide adenylyltransferase [Planctomycetota bacterium]|nr:nicotinate-nicotinamide nucleotide adenylyltransferase [Planctomycetota bacterium]